MTILLSQKQNPTSSPSYLQDGGTQFIQGLFSHIFLYMILIYIYEYKYITVCLFVCLHRNPTSSPSHLHGGRWDNSIHSRTVFAPNRLFAPEILAVFSRMEASLIRLFLFHQRIFQREWMEGGFF